LEKSILGLFAFRNSFDLPTQRQNTVREFRLDSGFDRNNAPTKSGDFAA
jgi:hypothetical protein